MKSSLPGEVSQDESVVRYDDYQPPSFRFTNRRYGRQKRDSPESSSGKAIPPYGERQVPEGSGQVLTIKNQLPTHEIEHDESVSQWDDYRSEIPSDG